MSLMAIIYKALFISIVFFMVILSVSYLLYLFRNKFGKIASQTLRTGIKPQLVSSASSHRMVYAEKLPSFNNYYKNRQYFETKKQLAKNRAIKKVAIARELSKSRYDILNDTMIKKPVDYLEKKEPQNYFGSRTLNYYRELSE